MLKNYIYISAFFIISVVSLSCKRGNEPAINDGVPPDHSIVECDFNSIQDIIDQAYEGKTSGCGELIYKPATDSLPYFGFNYKIIEIKYLCLTDSNENSGILTIYHQGERGGVGFSDSVVFDDFVVDKRHLKGYRTLKSDGYFNTENQRSYDVKNVSEVIFEDGKKVSLVQFRTIKKFQLKDVFNQYMEVTGNGFGKNKFGDSINHFILQPLILKGICAEKYRFPTQGVIQYNNQSNGMTRVLNYGEGDCDRVATMTNFKGNSKKVFLR